MESKYKKYVSMIKATNFKFLPNFLYKPNKKYNTLHLVFESFNYTCETLPQEKLDNFNHEATYKQKKNKTRTKTPRQ